MSKPTLKELATAIEQHQSHVYLLGWLADGKGPTHEQAAALLRAAEEVIEAADELEHDYGCPATFMQPGKCNCRIYKLIPLLANYKQMEGG